MSLKHGLCVAASSPLEREGRPLYLCHMGVQCGCRVKCCGLGSYLTYSNNHKILGILVVEGCGIGRDCRIPALLQYTAVYWSCW